MTGENDQTLGNRFALVPREIADGGQGFAGVDFGPRVTILARSPGAMLIWEGGHSWSVNGHQYYAESQVVGLPDRSPRFSGHPTWISYERNNGGGRLTPNRIVELADKIADLFGDTDGEIAPLIVRAVREKKTLLIEGGGPPVMPDWRPRGKRDPRTWEQCQAVYDQWKALPIRGFINGDSGKGKAGS